jgi:uncharacterized membrane protein
MKNFIFCCALLCSTAAFSEEAGIPAKIDAGVVLVEMTELVVTGSVEPVDAGVSVVVDPTFTDPLLSAKGFYHAVTTGNGWLIAMFILFFLVGGMRIAGKRVHAMIPDDTKHVILKPVEKVLSFIFDTKIGGWLMNWLSAIGGCVSTAAMAGHPVDGGTWKVAILASTGGTALIELKDDVMEWWDKRVAVAEEKKVAEEAAKVAAVPSPAAPVVAAVEPVAPPVEPVVPPVEPVVPPVEPVAPPVEPVTAVKATKAKKSSKSSKASKT